MEIRFTASILEAFDKALNLVRGTLYVHPKGKHPDPIGGIKVERPLWCNFILFDRITATPIRRMKRVNPGAQSSGHWELERTVEFWYWGHSVVTVTLVGMKIDGVDRGHDNGWFWGVSKIGYFQDFDTGVGTAPTGWREMELEVPFLSSHYTPA